MVPVKFPELRRELLFALMPTLVVLGALILINRLSRQQILFSSLASGAFFIYLDPRHRMNRIKTLIIAHSAGAVSGFILYSLLGPGYLSGGAAMTATILLMIAFHRLHPPAVGTSLIFAFRVRAESDAMLFLLALIVIALLVLLELAMERFLFHFRLSPEKTDKKE